MCYTENVICELYSALIDFGATVSLVSQKIINELGLTYYNNSNSAELQSPLKTFLY